MARQDTDSSELGLQETFAGAASELRLETEAIAEAIPQVRVLNLFNVSLVSWHAKAYSHAIHPLRKLSNTMSPTQSSVLVRAGSVMHAYVF